MTSASELFYNRRSRFGRNDPELGSGESSFDRICHHHNRRHQSNIRRDVNTCQPFRRSPHHPRLPATTPHRFAPPERESIWLDSTSSQATSGNTINSRNDDRRRGRLGSSGSERLPGAVLLARERLVQRLRGVSLSGNRRSNRVPASIDRNNFTFEDDFRLADVVDWETDISREWLAGTSPTSTGSPWREETNKRPSGLSQEAMQALHVGIFSNSDSDEEETLRRAVVECSICLETFLEGDKLICLPCGHGFHPCCLEPWVRTCGDCPNCRAAIVVSSCRARERS